MHRNAGGHNPEVVLSKEDMNSFRSTLELQHFGDSSEWLTRKWRVDPSPTLRKFDRLGW